MIDAGKALKLIAFAQVPKSQGREGGLAPALLFGCALPETRSLRLPVL